MATGVHSELGFPVQPNQQNKGHHGHDQNKNEQDLQHLHIERKGLARGSIRLNWRVSY
jgi:hypothetical protein